MFTSTEAVDVVHRNPRRATIHSVFTALHGAEQSQPALA
jgi:hypothetical protein